MINKLKQNGFSLVELLIYMGLSMILLMIISSLFISIVNTRGEIEKTSSVEKDARYITTRMKYDINRAQDITLPINLGDNSNTLDLIIDGNTYTYYIQNETLYLTDMTGSHALNSKGTKTNTINFTRLGNDGGKNGVDTDIMISGQMESEGKIESRNYNFFTAIR